MVAILVLVLSTLPLLAQVSYVPSLLGTWEPRNLVTKAGLVVSYDPGNAATETFNPAGYLAGSGVSWLSNRVSGVQSDLQQGTAANQPKISRTDNSGNICKYSEDITQTPWAATDATKTGAGELTFTAQNGKLIQNVPTASGLSYTFSFYARTNVPGNVNLTILHTDSATGNSTAQTITGVLTLYSVTVLGKAGAGGNVSFGIQDGNASGFGSILFTNMQVRVNTWNSTYIATTTTPIFPGLGGRSVLYFDGAAYYMKTAAFTLNQPEEVYLLCNQWTWTALDYLYDGASSASMGILQQGAASPSVRLTAGTQLGDNSNLSLGGWGVALGRFKSTDSSLTVNSTAPVSGNANTGNGSGFTLGGRGDNTQFANILVARTLICNKTNAPAEANYLKWGMMKQAGVY